MKVIATPDGIGVTSQHRIRYSIENIAENEGKNIEIDAGNLKAIKM